jgi:7-carboxy-7-deazaguanine synthase
VKISETFGPTIQGEGALIGMPTLFLRLGGCDYRCSWCDTPHAVLSEHRSTWIPTAVHTALDALAQLHEPPYWVTISGGNPALHDLGELLAQGQARGYSFAVETQGSIHKDWMSVVDHLVLSPKPPSSGMDTDWSAFTACMNATDAHKIALKVVVFNRVDLEYAKEVFSRALPGMHLSVQVGNDTWQPDQGVSRDELLDNLERLTEMALAVPEWHNVRVLPQLHTLIWGNRVGV